jgi:cytochrome c biogenesis protein CcmG, thiol:disulfide interchange protein DsbE
VSRPRPSNLPYLIAAVLSLGVILFAWFGRDRLQGVVPGGEAPVFEALTLDGEPRSLDDFRGKVVLLNVWATWCPPCRYEMPSMQRLYEAFAGQDFEIVAVSIDAPVGQRDPVGNPGGNIRAFADSLSLTFPILHDPQGRIQRTYQTTGVPETFVIGRDGRIYRRVSGATEWDRPGHIEFIQRLLDQEA